MRIVWQPIDVESAATFVAAFWGSRDWTSVKSGSSHTSDRTSVADMSERQQ